MLPGPSRWKDDYPVCQRSSQSPIDVTTGTAVYKPDLYEFDFTNYDSMNIHMQLENNGHSGKPALR